MKTKVLSATEVAIIKPHLLPDGEYDGTWGGYEVKVTIHGKNYILGTNNGIRGINVPCIVTVQGDIVTVETK